MDDEELHVAASALKHGVTVEDMVHALAVALRTFNLEDGLVMVIGPSRSGALLEVGIAESSEGDVLIIHAMGARSKFLPGGRR